MNNLQQIKISRQKGVALFISLIILLIMTILAIAGMQTTTMEEKMAGNYRTSNQAFQSAEAALRGAEVWLRSQASEPNVTANGSSNVWTLKIMDPDTSNSTNWWEERDAAWWQANAVAYTPSLTGINTAPSTIIEYKTYVPDDLLAGTGSTAAGQVYYQVTSRGTGGTDQAAVLLQSITSRRY